MMRTLGGLQMENAGVTTNAELLVEIGKLMQLVEELRDRVTRLEARTPYVPYSPYSPWPYYYPSWSSSGTMAITSDMSDEQIKAAFASVPRKYEQLFGLDTDLDEPCKAGRVGWVPDRVTEGRFAKDGGFVTEPKT